MQLDDIRKSRNKEQEEQDDEGLQPSPSKSQLPKLKAGGRGPEEEDGKVDAWGLPSWVLPRLCVSM